MKKMVILLLITTFLLNSVGSIDAKTESFVVVENKIDNELTKKNVYEYCKQNFDNPDIIWKQIMLETGHLKSKKCLKYNNLFGMKVPKLRETTSIGKTNDNHSIYNSWKESIDDYKLWQNYRPIKNGEDYLDYLLKRGYCPENSDYAIILRNIKLKF